MRMLETSIAIDAPAQTVWAVLDELASYPDWNQMLPDITGRTTVGGQLTTSFVRPNTPVMKISPKITRIVAARELRWLTQAPDPTTFSGEHIFRIVPRNGGGVTFHNDEIFEGSAVEDRWPALNTNTRAAYEEVNLRLKERAEGLACTNVSLHPAVEATAGGQSGLAGATLRCRCVDAVEVRLSEDIAHNHLCGCSKCWKPEGALLAQTAVVPAGTLQVVAGEARLRVVDAKQKIQRYACSACGVHLFGRVSDPDYHFYGVDFVHPELALGCHAPKPEFAGFLASLIESGTPPSRMHAVHQRLAQAGIPAYDAFSPEIMDVIAWHQVKLRNAA